MQSKLVTSEGNYPLVSVITPAYNAERFITETIDSVKKQTFPNWEMIIVDDRSNDSTADIIKSESEKDGRIKLHKLQKNSGAAVARNTAIKMATGDYIAFLDSDDLWYPNKLELQLEFMIKKDIAFSFTEYDVMKEDGTKIGLVGNIPQKVDYHSYLKNTIIGCSTVMLNVKKLGDVQFPNLRSRQDGALWLSLLRKGYTAYGLREVLTKYRKVSGSVSYNKIKASRQVWKVYREIEQLGFIRAVWYFSHYAYNAFKKHYK